MKPVLPVSRCNIISPSLGDEFEQIQPEASSIEGGWQEPERRLGIAATCAQVSREHVRLARQATPEAFANPPPGLSYRVR